MNQNQNHKPEADPRTDDAALLAVVTAQRKAAVAAWARDFSRPRIEARNQATVAPFADGRPDGELLHDLIVEQTNLDIRVLDTVAQRWRHVASLAQAGKRADIFDACMLLLALHLANQVDPRPVLDVVCACSPRLARAFDAFEAHVERET